MQAPAPDAASLAELAERDRPAGSEVYDVLLQHAYRGLRLQFFLRGLLVVFMVAVIVSVPPAVHDLAALVLVAAYVAWVIAVAIWSSRGGPGPIQWMWIPLLVDVLLLTAVTVIAGAYDSTSWTADVLVNGFFLVPVLAATQLRPTVCAVVVGPATVGYFAVSVATKAANTEPWSSIILRTSVLVAVSVGAVLLSRVQLSRVLQIGGLARERAALLDQLLGLEARERAAIAEQLHDGALQYLLAARQDLTDLRPTTTAGELVDRLDYALTESTGLLRSTVAQLHPAVLEQAGLVRALRDLCTELAGRAQLEVEFRADGWPEAVDRHDRLLYGCARELLTNVVKHAHAHQVRVELTQHAGDAVLSIADDGAGYDAAVAADRVAEGHVGLAGQRARVAAAGGELRLSTPGLHGAGTTATVRVPLG